MTPILTRRRFLQGMALACSCNLFSVQSTAAEGDSRELIADPQFERGFILLDPTPGKRVVCGELTGRSTAAKPVWDLAQWSSRFPLTGQARSKAADGSIRYENPGKSVVFGVPGSEAADLALGVNASVEYDGHARQPKDPWVHLLVQQQFHDPPAMDRIASARLRISVRLLQSTLHRTDDYSPGRHAAQFLMYFSVQNLNRQSKGYGHYLWFGVPLYDDRSRLVKKHAAQDFGGTNMYIFTPGSEAFTTASIHDGKWVAIDTELMPLIRQGLETAWAAGFLKESESLADYRIAGMNLGWEVPGLFDVAVQVRDLSLRIGLGH